MRSTIMATMRYFHIPQHACEALHLALLQHMLQLCIGWLLSRLVPPPLPPKHSQGGSDSKLKSDDVCLKMCRVTNAPDKNCHTHHCSSAVMMIDHAC